jgi:hypothetical protein
VGQKIECVVRVEEGLMSDAMDEHPELYVIHRLSVGGCLALSIVADI